MIKVKVVDREALLRITPEMLREYLEAHGWYRYSDGYWEKPITDGGVRTVRVPWGGCRDYVLRMGEALHQCELVEGRSQLDIYCELVGEPVEVALGIDVAHRIRITKN